MDKNSTRGHAALDRSLFLQLRRTDTALAGKNPNQPLILFRHQRWHMIQVGIIINAKMQARRGIVSVHFMSVSRARKTLHEWYPYSEIRSFDQICPAFRAELDAKVLPGAEDYRPLLRGGWVELAGGFTTDTLVSVSASGENEDARIAVIEDWMKTGEMGPFLHFVRTWDAFVQPMTGISTARGGGSSYNQC